MTNIGILDALSFLVNKIKKDEEKARNEFAERAKDSVVNACIWYGENAIILFTQYGYLHNIYQSIKDPLQRGEIETVRKIISSAIEENEKRIINWACHVAVNITNEYDRSNGYAGVVEISTMKGRKKYIENLKFLLSSLNKLTSEESSKTS